MILIVDLVGWTGAAMLITAYGLMSWQRVKPDSPAYQVLNIIGGSLILTNSVFRRALPSAATNAFWVLVGFGALLRMRHSRKQVMAMTLLSERNDPA
jgi:hypothetical protein